MDGGPLLLADGFTPNNGLGVSSYPQDVAPPGAIEVHMAANRRKGRLIVLSLDFARTMCEVEGVPFHVSSCMIGQKLDADPRYDREAVQRLLLPPCLVDVPREESAE